MVAGMSWRAQLANRHFIAILGVILSISGCHAVGWEHQHGGDHALAGRIVDLDSQTLIDEATLLERLAAADIVLIGESHGNRDHHRLQARLVRAMGAAVNGVVFEMIDTGQQTAVVLHLQDRPGDTMGLGPALAWESSGWPDWMLYEPIAAAAVEVDAEIVGGNLPRSAVDKLMAEGFASLDPALVARSGLGEPLDPALEAQVVATIDEAHCGFAPADLLPAMLDVQRGRDALMADRLVRLRGGGQSVLIAGSEHVRNDWGVPYYLERRDSEAAVLTIALREVDERLTTLPVDLPYDIVWFTPRRQPMGFDPCDAYREQLKQLDAGLGRLAAIGPAAG